MKLPHLVGLLLACAGASLARAQFLPTVPVVDFRLPMFDATTGHKTWEVRGSEGRYIDENHIEISALNLKVFAGDEAATLETEITSPTATVQPRDRLVFGPGQLRIVGTGYELFGDDWTYEGKRKTIVIRRGVVVTFADDIGRLLP